MAKIIEHERFYRGKFGTAAGASFKVEIPDADTTLTAAEVIEGFIDIAASDAFKPDGAALIGLAQCEKINRTKTYLDLEAADD